VTWDKLDKRTLDQDKMLNGTGKAQMSNVPGEWESRFKKNDDGDLAAMVYQRTLKRSVSCAGVALHSGHKVGLTLLPAEDNSGIVFSRSDVTDQDPEVPATWDRVVDTRLCTAIGNKDGTSVSTIEHLMAAFAGCGIDNVRVKLDGPEVPIMDGSSEPFVLLIKSAGVVQSNTARRVIRILKPVNVEIGNSRATLTRSNRPKLDVEIDFDSEVISKQTLSMGLVNGSFCKELARARTFGFLHEVEQMRAAGLAKGGSLENAIVVSREGVMNDEGLRFDDEFVRHKMLDAIGDLYLAGGHIIGQFNSFRSGHTVNNALLRALFADQSAWEFDIMRQSEIATAVDGGIIAERAAVLSP
jgi:UDP-3-O-[3-hydroxymyristoyl] N-acetylglucosamine deacetylase